MLKMARLSRVELEKKEAEYFSDQFNETIATIDNLQSINVEKSDEVYSVAGLKNVFREDEIDESRILKQEEALSNAKKVHNGYLVVERVFDES